MDSFTLVIFGLTSNLAQIKLIPTLYDLVAGRYLPANFHIVGLGRTAMDQSAFHKFISATLRAKNRHHTHPIDEKIERELLSHLSYVSADLTSPTTYTNLRKMLHSIGNPNHLFYLATFPSLYPQIFRELNDGDLTNSTGWTRILIEKPIGTDQASAKQLNDLLTRYFAEDQIFRLDHYLGKETLQNILTFRFGNGILEPLIRAAHIDHIQVTASEDFGIGGRGGYYDENGAIKDVAQNHVLQMIALSTMEAPASYSNAEITASRVSALRHLRPEPKTLVTGQYDGYLKEPHVKPGSVTETFFAFRTHLDTPRFRGIPIYVRGGKYLARTATEVAIVFKTPVSRLFSHLESGLDPNILVYRIQPNEGVVLRILTKKPGHELKLEESFMQFCYPRTTDLPDAYERLIMDAVRGDQTFFNDADEVEAQWSFTDPLVRAAQSTQPIKYPRGSWGPREADELLTKDGHSWFEPSTAFCAI